MSPTWEEGVTRKKTNYFSDINNDQQRTYFQEHNLNIKNILHLYMYTEIPMQIAIPGYEFQISGSNWGRKTNGNWGRKTNDNWRQIIIECEEKIPPSWKQEVKGRTD